MFVPTVWIYSTQDLKVFNADLEFINDLHSETIRRARAAGVKIAAGVDCGYNRCLPLLRSDLRPFLPVSVYGEIENTGFNRILNAVRKIILPLVREGLDKMITSHA